MKKLCLALAILMIVPVMGCERISKPYISTMERVDQKVEGNRGYLVGTPPPAEDRTGIKRTLITVDMDLVEIKGEKTTPTTIVRNKQTAEDKNIK